LDDLYSYNTLSVILVAACVAKRRLLWSKIMR